MKWVYLVAMVMCFASSQPVFALGLSGDGGCCDGAIEKAFQSSSEEVRASVRSILTSLRKVSDDDLIGLKFTDPCQSIDCGLVTPEQAQKLVETIITERVVADQERLAKEANGNGWWSAVFTGLAAMVTAISLLISWRATVFSHRGDSA